MKEKICAYIDSQREDFLKDLKSLVDIKSVREAPLPGMPFGEGPARALKEAIKISASHGFDTINFENYAGEITYGKDPVLMLLAHLDVVDEGDFWTYEPYNMKIVDGKAYGRGTTDDKGAMLCCLYALKAARELFGEPKKGVRLVMGCGEETGSEDMDYYFSKREKLPFTLSPDADYPLINLEKGRFAPSFTKTAENCGNKRVVSFTGGTTGNIVPCKASVALSGISAEEIAAKMKEIAEKTGVDFTLSEKDSLVTVSALGVSSHAAHPEGGNNAQTALISLVNSLPLSGNEVTASFRALEKLFPHKETDGCSVGVKMADEISGALTLNFGVLHFNDGVFTGSLDLRCPLCANEKNVKAVIGKAFSENGFSFIGSPEMIPVHYVPEDAPVIKTALKVYEDYTGLKGECLAIGGGTYVHDIEGGVAFGIEFHGTDYRIHGADEFAVIDELLLTAKMYTAIIYELCYKD
ncbi:MAG: Sapep family Mn(2+)-dependent dipeptidase [Clostridia bacterium]|nr:Sapep family Mn(2+)-dependent dipeptidase [Clostridia bacterium]